MKKKLLVLLSVVLLLTCLSSVASAAQYPVPNNGGITGFTDKYNYTSPGQTINFYIKKIKLDKKRYDIQTRFQRYESGKWVTKSTKWLDLYDDQGGYHKYYTMSYPRGTYRFQSTVMGNGVYIATLTSDSFTVTY